MEEITKENIICANRQAIELFNIIEKQKEQNKQRKKMISKPKDSLLNRYSISL